MIPYAIEYGMSLKEFWEDNPDFFWAYRFSYINKKQREAREQNQAAWIQGLYIFEGVSVALANAFGKGKHEYSKEPYDLFGDKKPKKIEQENMTVIELKGRVAQVQALWKQKEKGSTTESEGKGGENE